MRRHFASISIVFCCVITLMGLNACGTTSSRSTSNEDTESEISLSEIFGNSDDDTETESENNEVDITDTETTDTEEETLNTVTEEADSIQEDIVYDVDNLSEEQQNMLLLMDSRCYAVWNSYYTDKASYIWGSLCYLFVDYSSYYIDDTSYAYYNDGRIFVDENYANECASSMFDDFDGEILSENKEDGYYYFYLGDRGDVNVRIISWVDHPDGTCSVEIEYGDWDFTELFGTFQVELIKNTDSESLFQYTITDTVVVDEYILPDSDRHYYTESELSDYTPIMLRMARNEIYARHGRIFESEDLQIYFESQSWYEGTIEPSDFDEKVFNDYEKANIKTIEALENE